MTWCLGTLLVTLERKEANASDFKQETFQKTKVPSWMSQACSLQSVVKHTLGVVSTLAKTRPEVAKKLQDNVTYKEVHGTLQFTPIVGNRSGFDVASISQEKNIRNDTRSPSCLETDLRFSLGSHPSSQNRFRNHIDADNNKQRTGNFDSCKNTRTENRRNPGS